MRSDRHSRTAEAAAALRALHRLVDRPRVFDDPLATALTSAGWRRRLRLIEKLPRLAGDPLGLNAALRGHIIGRSRFAEDHLRSAVDDGIRQYLIVGAGFDSFALRYSAPPAGFRLFELDHPATQAEKRRRLAGHRVPDWAAFIPIDFESQQLADVLRASDIDASRPLFLSWLGTTPYLSREAIFTTLKTLAAFAAPGSRLALDFSGPHRQLAFGRGALRGAALLAYTRLVGEPLVDHGLAPAEFVARCAALGWQPLEVLDNVELARRYFSASSPALSCIEGSHFGLFELADRY